MLSLLGFCCVATTSNTIVCLTQGASLWGCSLGCLVMSCIRHYIGWVQQSSPAHIMQHHVLISCFSARSLHSHRECDSNCIARYVAVLRVWHP